MEEDKTKINMKIELPTFTAELEAHVEENKIQIKMDEFLDAIEKTQKKIEKIFGQIVIPKKINKSLEDAAINLGKFDVIVMHHVLEHVLSPKRTLEITRDLLDNNGIAVLEVPNQFFQLQNEFAYRLFRNAPKPDNCFHHLTFFSMRTFERYLMTEGFELVKLTQFRSMDSQTKSSVLHQYFRIISDRLKLGFGPFFLGVIRKTS